MIFFKLEKKIPKKSTKNVATKLKGGGGKALVAGPLKNRTFIFLRLPVPCVVFPVDVLVYTVHSTVAIYRKLNRATCWSRIG